MCNLGSLNLSRIEDIGEMAKVTYFATLFLLCGTLKAHFPYEKISEVRMKNRRLGLGLMGVHEWLLKRGYKYEVVPELHNWLKVYKGVSDDVSLNGARRLQISKPVANRAIAPTGTIGMLAGTTTGIEPIFAVAYKRRYLVEGTKRKFQYAVDSCAQELIDLYNLEPDKIETASSLANDFERRIAFQADIQDYVDMAISSTINLPEMSQQSFSVEEFASVLAKYAPRLRGFTCYPNGARGGQPITEVPYQDVVDKLGKEFSEHVETNDVCELTGSGHCGV